MASTESASPQEIFGAFEAERLPAAKVSAPYKIALALVALMMVLLPLIYIGMIIAVAYGVYHQVTQGESFQLVTLVVGVIGIFFLIKPLFARSEKGPEGILLAKGEEPVLEEFVARICRAVGAPLPKVIEVDCNVNASASFRKGFFSMLGSDLKLTIGLPLVAGMNLRSFGGVLAHEFGHFGQGTGMRLTYIIRRVNFWFVKVVHQRDQWDARLEAWSKGGDIRLMIILMIARVFVWLTRRILDGLMRLGHLISCFALRQMEFDADSYEVQFAGSDAFKETSFRLQELGVGSGHAHELLSEAYSEGRLAKNLPMLSRAKADRLPEELRQEIQTASLGQKTGFWDTHPCDADRIIAASGIGAPGIFHLLSPSTDLFRDFDSLAERVTLHYYREEHELLDISEENLVDNDLLTGEGDQREEERAAVSAYFMDRIDMLRPIEFGAEDLDLVELPDSRGEIATKLQERRGRLESLSEELAPVFEAFDKADGAILSKGSAAALRKAAFTIDPKEFGLENQDLAHINEQIVGQRDHLNAAKEKLAEFDRAAVMRVAASLKVAREGIVEIQPTRDGLDIKGEIDFWIGYLASLRPVVEKLPAVRELTVRQNVLWSNVDGNGENSEDLVREIQTNSSRLETEVKKLMPELSAITYPFEHAKGNVTLLGLIHDDTQEGDKGLSSAESVQKRVYGLCIRALGQLTRIACAVEAELVGGGESR